MTALLLTAHFNFGKFFLTLWLKSRARICIFTLSLITLFKIISNDYYSNELSGLLFLLVKKILWEKRQVWRGSADFRQVRWHAEKERNVETKLEWKQWRAEKKIDRQKEKYLTAPAFHPTLPVWSFTPLQYLPSKQLPPWAVSLETVPPHTQKLSAVWQACTKPN